MFARPEMAPLPLPVGEGEADESVEELVGLPLPLSVEEVADESVGLGEVEDPSVAAELVAAVESVLDGVVELAGAVELAAGAVVLAVVELAARL